MDGGVTRLVWTLHGGKVIMGRFIYEGGPKVELEDRTLTHVQLAITAKLRRGEPFTFTWREDASTGGGRTTVWIHAASSMVFKYFGSRAPAINRAWVEALTFTANSPSGLYVVPEPAEGSPVERSFEPASA